MTDEGKFVWFSDIHFDPLYGRAGAVNDASCSDGSVNDAPWGKLGCDSPVDLVRSSLDYAQSIVSEPDFFLITGDLCRHKNDDVNVVAMLSGVADEMRQSYNNTVFVPSMGNNDVVPDYHLDVLGGDNQLGEIREALSDIFPRTRNDTFARGGYLSVNVPGGAAVVLSLNTVIYSVWHSPNSTGVGDPFGQFAWLEMELATMRREGQWIYVSGHIPPTVGSYRRTQLWHGKYLDRYLALMLEYSDVVAAQLFGHVHSDEFRAASLGGKPLPPLLMTGALTPVYSNNPNFRVVRYNRLDGTILDYDTYFFDVAKANDAAVQPQWKISPSFREAFGVPDMSAGSLSSVADTIASSEKAGATFLSRRKADIFEPPCFRPCRARWNCTLRASSLEEYRGCLLTAGLVGEAAAQPPPAGALHYVLHPGISMFVLFGFLLLACGIRARRRWAYKTPEPVEIDGDENCDVLPTIREIT
eukprot:CAMPEP_0194340934 /NCGR_PEP_ID=MMETSP0171-20130528/88043_1 /TAXON_ID=218684 /ORGANISM="Corethron pennatum, Strain L29A3" /LENGTH=470 /DNA_ID=CAMNT_0039106077 /DNA_START=146 /DNA_END=1558 /DNA_ORIENTATION=-